MLKPFFANLGFKARVLKLKQDVVKIVVEGGSRKPSHIFKHKSPRPYFPHSPHCLGEHIAII
ncbi:hypothetical protein EMIT0P44_200015 [Pseudomonas sp. IT-P44]